MAALTPNTDASIAFLRSWHGPDGPWLIGEIDPNAATGDRNPPRAREFTDPVAMRHYLDSRAGVANLYFTPNHTERGITTTPRKNQMTAVVALFVDLDLPKTGPYSAQTDENLALLLARIRALSPRPAVIVYTGGGYQAFWLFPDPYPVELFLDRVEATGRAIATALGSDAVQNVNRWMRLPGTINVPNETKRARGRVEALSRIVEADWARTWSYETDVVPTLPPEHTPPDPAPIARAAPDLPTKWRSLALSGDAESYAGDRSRLVFAFVFALLRRGWADDDILPFLTDPHWGISAHCRAQSNPLASARRQIERARERMAESWDLTAQGAINTSSPKNIRLALSQMGVRLTYDELAGRTFVNGVGPLRPLDDRAESQIIVGAFDQCGFSPNQQALLHVTTTLALANSYHPVRDYLASVQPTWDGISRVDTWLIDLAGANDTPFVRAVSRLVLVAAVRRVRQPGCKFDEMLVLISERQGTNKSTALAALAVNDDWFTDSLPLHADDKRFIEATAGKWIVECGELQGIRQADVESVKTMLSRRFDTARLAYAHHPVTVMRQCVIVASTNLTVFLRDTSNRRFLPVFIVNFDVPGLLAVRDQLWAEAAMVEASGASIRLDEALWDEAARQQDAVRYGDPWADALGEHLAGIAGSVPVVDVWKLLGRPVSQASGPDNGRLTQAMAEHGWERKLVNLHGRNVRCFLKGETPEERRRPVYVHLDDPVMRTYRASTSESPTADETHEDF